ncbi:MULTISPECIES: hypothetical protein [Citrobacter]|uniref:hypothetical protein n=1 Tax=Citrobacter TaxID=544 RepID=UPI000B0370EA|nr:MULTISPECIES: hypothetical protein [Citrobacter]MDM3060412.1 hypothetical protein [Citrobacter sp. Cf146]MDM3117989.1 hypothetical protein [Citrobacter sp. Cf135]
MKPSYEELELQLEESQREFRAADATIHNLELKLTDMAVQLANSESKRRELAAENAAMKQNAVQAEKVIMSSKFDYWSDRVELSAVVGRIIETPANDAFLAEVRANGVEMAKDIVTREACRSEMINIDISSAFSGLSDDLGNLAAQLRKGAAL